MDTEATGLDGCLLVYVVRSLSMKFFSEVFSHISEPLLPSRGVHTLARVAQVALRRRTNNNTQYLVLPG